MFFYLSKVLYFMIQPINWVFILLTIGLFTKKSTKRKRLLSGAFILLYLFANPFIFNQFAKAWELPASDQSAIEKSYPMAIVLGGMISQEEGTKNINFGRNSDRILQVLPIYFSGHIDKILIAGGSGSLIHDNKEADILADYLVKIGVKREDLILESESRNTYENALYSKQIIDKLKVKEKVLLCTSAMHMRRSVACFSKLGIDVDLFVVDKVSGKSKFYPSYLFIPSAQVLSEWYAMMHEWVGTIIYKIMGYA